MEIGKILRQLQKKNNLIISRYFLIPFCFIKYSKFNIETLFALSRRKVDRRNSDKLYRKGERFSKIQRVVREGEI